MPSPDFNHQFFSLAELNQAIRELLDILNDLDGAIKDALRLGAISFDAVKHLVLCRIERRPPKLDLDIYPYLPKARVATTSAASDMNLLAGIEP